jgi:hypothetical protein
LLFPSRQDPISPEEVPVKKLLVATVLVMLASWPATAKMMPPPPCQSDADCGTCQACVGGACMGLGLLECNTDTDCGADEYCQIDDLEPCKNHCVSTQCLLVFCAQECDPWTGPQCGAGESCVQVLKGCCGQCEPAMPICASDADCDLCSACLDGLCIALPKAPDCVQDSDCGLDEYCITYPGAECRNRCASQTCWVVDCLGDCEPVVNPCGAGQTCVEPIPGCCGMCQEAACATDSDCGPCAICLDGLCMGLGDISCQSDGDCFNGETCVIDPENPCANHCAPAGEPCTVDYDCAPCQACVAGVCVTPAPTGCLIDADCDEGEVCVQGLPGDCQNHCEPTLVPCATDSDCGACQVCVAGQCEGMGVLLCNTHADCGADEYCHEVLGEPCKNACEPLPEGACRDHEDCEPGEGCVMLPDGSGLGDCFDTSCTLDADCGACGVCVNGQCQGTGLVVCSTDADCGEGKRCEIDAVAPCKNACVPAAVEPDASSGDSTSPDTLEPEAGADAVDDDTTKEPTDDKKGAGDCSFAGFQRTSGLPGVLAGLLLVGLIVRRRRIA